MFSPGGNCHFACMQNMKLLTNKYMSGGLHEKHVVGTWIIGNHLSVCRETKENEVAGRSSLCACVYVHWLLELIGPLRKNCTNVSVFKR